MKNIFLLFCALYFLFLNTAQAQDIQRIDSLLIIYQNSDSEDTLKINALYQIFDAYMYHDQEKAEHYLSLVHDIALKTNNEYEIAKYNGSKGVLFDITGQPDSSKIYYKKAISYYEENKINDKLIIVRFNLGMLELTRGNYDATIDLVNQNIISPELVTPQTAPPQAMSYGLLSRVYRKKGFYQLSLKNALIALNIIETTTDELRIADALKDLANSERALLHFQKAIEYHTKAITLYEKHNDKFFLAGSKNDIGENYFQLEDYSKALEVFEESLTLAKEVGSIDAETAALNNIGKIYMGQGEFERGLLSFQESMAIYKNSDYPTRLSETQFLAGKLYAKWGQHSKALPFFDECITYANSIEKKGFLEEIYLSRAESHEALGNFKSSHKDYEQSYSISKSNYDTKQITAIEELRTIHNLEQKEKEIALLAKNAELDKVKSTRLWISLLAAIGLGSILLWGQWLRRRKEKEIEGEKQKVVELKNQKLKDELDFKKQELTSKALQLCRKNEFLQSLEKEVKGFKAETEGTERHRLEKLSRKINRDMDADADWEQFLKSFETVHADFKKIVSQKHPDLSSNEMRITYLLYMNLDSKNIASLLNISSEGVKKARQRMRKKLNIDSSIRLQDYFMRIGSSQLKAE